MEVKEKAAALRARTDLHRNGPAFVLRHVLPAFGDDNDVCPTAAGPGVAKVAAGQPPVTGKEIGKVGQQDVEPGPDSTVLKGIIEDDGPGAGPVMQQLWDGNNTLFPHGYRHIGELDVKLHGFIPDIQRGSRLPCQRIAPCLAFITTAQYGDGKPVLQYPDHPFYHRRFTGATDDQVAYTDNGQVERGRVQETLIVAPVTYLNDNGIDQGEGKQKYSYRPEEWEIKIHDDSVSAACPGLWRPGRWCPGHLWPGQEYGRFRITRAGRAHGGGPGGR